MGDMSMTKLWSFSSGNQSCNKKNYQSCNINSNVKDYSVEKKRKWTIRVNILGHGGNLFLSKFGSFNYVYSRKGKWNFILTMKCLPVFIE